MTVRTWREFTRNSTVSQIWSNGSRWPTDVDVADGERCRPSTCRLTNVAHVGQLVQRLPLSVQGLCPGGLVGSDCTCLDVFHPIDSGLVLLGEDLFQVLPSCLIITEAIGAIDKLPSRFP